MGYDSLVEIAVAYYKDKVQQEILENFRKECNALLQADAEARRLKAREKILAMARLRMEKRKFEMTYHRISASYGNIEAVDDYLCSIERTIKRLSYEKNHNLG